MKYITVTLTARDVLYLERATSASGGLQTLIDRLKRGIRIKPGEFLEYEGRRVQVKTLTVTQDDVDRIPRYWANTGRKPGNGGYQKRLPIESLRAYLPTVAPLFSDAPLPIRRGVSYVYFKKEWFGDGRIKIGRGNAKRARSGRSTDNPRELITLLRLPETDERDEGYYHRRFARFRIKPDQEWFWPDDELMAFITDGISASGAA